MFCGLSPKSDIRLISAMVAFSLFEAAYYSEIIRAGVYKASVKGQFSASLALGMTKSQTMRLVILPQAFRAMDPFIAHTRYRFISRYLPLSCMCIKSDRLFP